jgi:hypothetical protein
MSDAGFRRLKSELHEGGERELRRVIEEIRAISATPVEREFNAKWALDLKARIQDGKAVSFLWAVADMPSEGRFVRLRINGQHSSWALAELLKAGELPGGLAIYLDTYSVSNEAGAVNLFRQFDARQSARRPEDISGAYQCFQPALRDCHRGVLKTAVEGITWYRREVQGKPVASGYDIYKLFDEQRLHPFLLAMNDTLKDGKANELKRVPILAAAFGTSLDDHAQAVEFWRLTALGTKRNEEDAATDLDNEILRLRNDKEKVTAGDLYAKCAKAWDAFNNGIRVSNFRVNTKKKGLPPIGGELAA